MDKGCSIGAIDTGQRAGKQGENTWSAQQCESLKSYSFCKGLLLGYSLLQAVRLLMSYGSLLWWAITVPVDGHLYPYKGQGRLQGEQAMEKGRSTSLQHKRTAQAYSTLFIFTV